MRENGLYWVKICSDYWTVGEFFDGEWLLLGSDESYKDDHFEAIGEPVVQQNKVISNWGIGEARSRDICTVQSAV